MVSLLNIVIFKDKVFSTVHLSSVLYNVDNLHLTFAIGNAETSRGSLSCETLLIPQTRSLWLYLCLLAGLFLYRITQKPQDGLLKNLLNPDKQVDPGSLSTFLNIVNFS